MNISKHKKRKYNPGLGGGEFYCKHTPGLPQYLTWPERILRTPLGHTRCWRQVLVAPEISGSQVLGGGGGGGGGPQGLKISLKIIKIGVFGLFS